MRFRQTTRVIQTDGEAESQTYNTKIRKRARLPQAQLHPNTYNRRHKSYADRIRFLLVTDILV